ncbi:MAG: thiamine diphosphokinase [Clostridia bacterium]|nr:thiamine diphosphokinase [Clostridia bacterium]
MKSAAIVLNYDFNRKITEEDVIAADGGYNRAVARGYMPKVVVGDLDSAKDIAEGVEIVKFNKRKDQTDGELAIKYAVSAGYRKLYIYGASGGRMDHVLYNMRLIAIAALMGVKCVICGDEFDAYYANSTFELSVKKGDLISLVPYQGKVHIMSTEGLGYEINDVELDMFNTVGVSNFAIADKITVKIDKGDALIFHVFQEEV